MTEYSVAPTDDLIRFWKSRSQQAVEVANTDHKSKIILWHLNFCQKTCLRTHLRTYLKTSLWIGPQDLMCQRFVILYDSAHNDWFLSVNMCWLDDKCQAADEWAQRDDETVHM